MGCDIHGIVEVKQTDLGGGDGLWFATLLLDMILERNYDAFAHLFGVRYYEGEHEIEADGYDDYMEPKLLYADRGFPHDASDTTVREHDEWGEDAHSETWAYHHEVESALINTDIMRDRPGWYEAVQISKQLSELFGNSQYADGTIRWVVWFDN